MLYTIWPVIRAIWILIIVAYLGAIVFVVLQFYIGGVALINPFATGPTSIAVIAPTSTKTNSSTTPEPVITPNPTETNSGMPIEARPNHESILSLATIFYYHRLVFLWIQQQENSRTEIVAFLTISLLSWQAARARAMRRREQRFARQ